MTGTKQNRIAQAAVVFLVLLLGYSPAGLTRSIQVVVSVAPMAWLVEQIGGEVVAIDTLVADGHVPESSQPSPHSLAGLPNASIIVLTGHPSFTFERRFVIPQLSALQRTEVISLHDLAAGLYSVADIDRDDPHLWTSPRIMEATVERIAARLSVLDPDHATTYKKRAAQLALEINSLIERFRSMVEHRPAKRFLVYHPAWGGLARDVGLVQVAIEHEGKSPGPARLAQLLDDIDREGDSMIIASPGHAQRDAAVLASQHHLRIVTVDPLMRNWFEMMMQMMAALEGVHD
jgi:zinc transport system substrate-binding protein